MLRYRILGESNNIVIYVTLQPSTQKQNPIQSQVNKSVLPNLSGAPRTTVTRNAVCQIDAMNCLLSLGSILSWWARGVRWQEGKLGAQSRVSRLITSLKNDASKILVVLYLTM